MARQEIDITTPQPNGKMGEPTKSAWEKVNDMTLELYEDAGQLSTDVAEALSLANSAFPKSGGTVTGTVAIKPNGDAPITPLQTMRVLAGTVNSGNTDNLFIDSYKLGPGDWSNTDWFLYRRVDSTTMATIILPGGVTGPTAGGVALGFGGVGQWGVYSSNGSLFPLIDNTYAIGTPAYRSSVVYSATGSINTSDAREKTEINEFSEREMSAAKDIAREIGFYKFLSSIEEKGESARWHAGLTVQRVIEIMESHGLDALSYSFICHDKWQNSQHAPAGDRYSFRPDGLIMFIARGLESRISDIESRINDYL